MRYIDSEYLDPCLIMKIKYRRSLFLKWEESIIPLNKSRTVAYCTVVRTVAYYMVVRTVAYRPRLYGPWRTIHGCTGRVVGTVYGCTGRVVGTDYGCTNRVVGTVYGCTDRVVGTDYGCTDSIIVLIVFHLNYLFDK